MILGYLRVSTSEQDVETQRSSILNFAFKKNMKVNEFIEIEISSQKSYAQRKISELFEKLSSEDTLIVTELSRLGRSIVEVLDIVNTLIEQGVHIYTLKENIDLKNNHSIQSKVMITMFGLFSELERDMISQRTREALARKKAQGVKLGRPKGPGKSKLDPFKDQIEKYLSKKVSLLSISKIMEVSYPTIYKFVKKRDLMKKNERGS